MEKYVSLPMRILFASPSTARGANAVRFEDAAQCVRHRIRVLFVQVGDDVGHVGNKLLLVAELVALVAVLVPALARPFRPTDPVIRPCAYMGICVPKRECVLGLEVLVVDRVALAQVRLGVVKHLVRAARHQVVLADLCGAAQHAERIRTGSAKPGRRACAWVQKLGGGGIDVSRCLTDALHVPPGP